MLRMQERLKFQHKERGFREAEATATPQGAGLMHSLPSLTQDGALCQSVCIPTALGFVEEGRTTVSD